MNKRNKWVMILGLGSISLIILSLIVIATQVVNSPNTCSGQWTSCSSAFFNDANRASFTATNTANGSGIWRDYGFSIPNSAQIDSVKVRADFFATTTKGYIDVKVSGDNGATYGPSHTVGGNTAEQTFIIDVTSDVAWTGQKFNNSQFRVNATCFKSSSGGTNPGCRLDWVPVNVTYTPFDFSVSANPASGQVVQGDNSTTNATVTLLGGISQSVSLGYIGCPTGATCSFSPSFGTPTYSSVFTVATSLSTPTGSYIINITGTGDGKTRGTIYTLNVSEADTNPVATALANPTSGNAILTVQFNGTVSGGNAPFTYLWDFNDSSTSTQQNPKHNFTAKGNYTVSFTVTDNDGDMSTDNVDITVTQPDLIVESIVFGESTNGTTYVEVNTTVKNIGDGTASPYSFTQLYSLTGATNEYTAPLAPGGTQKFQKSYNCSAAHTVNATADITGLILESDETNNFLGGVFIDCVI